MGRPGTLVEALPTEGRSPLSAGQRALWFLQVLAPESSAYHVVAAGRVLPPGIDLPALRQALDALARRHPALRTTFGAEGGEPFQQVHERLGPELIEIDARGWTAERREEVLAREALRPFDLAAGPLLRVAVLAEGEGRTRLLLVIHHLVADFWSLAVVARELGAAYDAARAGEVLDLAPLSACYQDFIVTQEQWLASPAAEEAWDYWRERLAGVPDVLQLPTDHPRPARPSGRAACVQGFLEGSLAGRLGAFASQVGATSFSVLLAGFQVLLSRLAGSSDFLVGTPTAGRERSGFADLVGYFVNPVPLRAELADDPTFRELVTRNRRAVHQALRRSYPFPWLAERLRPTRDLSLPPLVQVLFVWQRARRGDQAALAAFALGLGGHRLQLGGLELESIPPPVPSAAFDLTLSMAELGAELGAILTYDRALFDATTAQRLLARLVELLASAVAVPDQPVSQLSWLSAGERQQVVWEWRGPAVVGGVEGEDVWGRFAAVAEELGERVALVWGEERWSYEALSAWSARWGRALVARGVGEASSLPAEALGRCEVIAPEELERAQPAGGSASWAISPGRAWGIPARGLAYLIYTSGSTGRPKAVAIEAGGALARLSWARERYGEGELSGVLASTSVCFDLSVFELFGPLCSGGTVVLVSDALALGELPA
ncbi:MAG TPA: condensation domain-containing protein, partial [Thermoanaerobaculia bacterium]|nr:condensation domain-containing protein [Thermoanaerobaculia bacterium]